MSNPNQVPQPSANMLRIEAATVAQGGHGVVEAMRVGEMRELKTHSDELQRNIDKKTEDILGAGTTINRKLAEQIALGQTDPETEKRAGFLKDIGEAILEQNAVDANHEKFARDEAWSVHRRAAELEERQQQRAAEQATHLKQVEQTQQVA